MAAHIVKSKLLADTMSYGIPTAERLVGKYTLQTRPSMRCPERAKNLTLCRHAVKLYGMTLIVKYY